MINIRLIVSPLASPGRFSAHIEGSERILVESSRTPFCDAARALLAAGCDPSTKVIMRHAGSDIDALKATVGAAAKLAIDENPRPRFRQWHPLTWDRGLPIAPNDDPAVEQPNEGERPSEPLAVAARPSSKSSPP